MNEIDPYSAAASLGLPIEHPNAKYNKFNCPFPDHADSDPSFVIWDNGAWKCYGCGRKGDFYDLIGMLVVGTGYNKHGDFKAVVDFIASLGVKPMTQAEINQRIKTKQTVAYAELDKNWIADWQDNLVMEKPVFDWLEYQRGIHPDWILCNGIGYTAHDPRIEEIYHNRIAIPWFYRGHLTAIKLRRHPHYKTADGQKDRWKYISMRGSRFGGMFFNSDTLLLNHEIIYIAETELDAAAIMSLVGADVAVATPAGSFTGVHATQLLKAKQIIVVTDRDKNGAGLKSSQAISLLIRRAKIALPPDGYKDIGEWIERHPGQLPDWLPLAS